VEWVAYFGVMSIASTSSDSLYGLKAFIYNYARYS
jgi:hypothetical protein